MLPVSSSASPSNNATSNEQPPSPTPPNPILAAYEGWYQNTPFVTRSIISIQAISYLISWFANDLHFSLANIPYFIMPPHFEVYRLVTSVLLNNSLLSLIFAYLSFNEQGKRLEYSMGSTRFATLCFSIGMLSNVSFFTLTVLTFYLSGGGPGQAHIPLSSSASGIWLVLFGIIAMECVHAPPGTQRKLFLFQVPVRYYPIALMLFFALLSGSFSLAYCLSIAVGYLYGFGYLDRIQLSHGKATEWEQDGSITGSSNSGSSFHCFASMTRRDGWVSCHAATGSDAWIESASMGGGGGGMTMPLFRRTPGANNVASLTGAMTAAAPPGSSRPGSVFKTGSGGAAGVSTTSASSMSAGRTLGRGGGESSITGTASSSSSTTRRPGHHTAADARAARLQALEQRRSHYPDGGGEGGSVSNNNSSKTQQTQEQSTSGS